MKTTTSGHSSDGVDPDAMNARALAMTLEDEAPRLAVPLVFEAVYEEWLDFVWRSMRRLGVQDAALDDAVQDVFIVVHRRLADFHARSTIKTWLFGIAIRVASDYRRSAARRPTEPISGELHDASAGPFDALTHKRALVALDAMLACLDEDKRAVFVMMDIEEMSAVEAAEALGIKTNTAYSRLRLARAEIEAMVAARGGIR